MTSHGTLPSEVDPRDLAELIDDSTSLPRPAAAPAQRVDLDALHIGSLEIDPPTLALLEGMSEYGD